MYNNPQQPPQWQQQADLNRSYVASAWLSAALAFVFIVPGLIAVIINLTEAEGVKKRTGVAPQGYGCLWAVLIWCLLPLIIGGCILFSILTGLFSLGTAATSLPTTQATSAPDYQPSDTTPLTSAPTNTPTPDPNYTAQSLMPYFESLPGEQVSDTSSGKTVWTWTDGKIYVHDHALSSSSWTNTTPAIPMTAHYWLGVYQDTDTAARVSTNFYNDTNYNLYNVLHVGRCFFMSDGDQPQGDIQQILDAYCI